GHVFDSMAERDYYIAVIRPRLQGGEIAELRFHPRYVLQEGFRDRDGKYWRPIVYEGDFEYKEDGRLVVEDTKGFKTKDFRIKEKLFRKRYPDIELRLTRV